MRPNDACVAFAALRGASPETMSRDELAAHVGHIQRLRSWLDAEEVHAVRRCRTLDAEGSCEPATSLTTRIGKQSSRASKTISERAEVLDQLPEVEAALTSGDLSAGHVDAIAVAARRLSEPARAEFNEMQSALVAEASRTGVDGFARSARDLAGSIIKRHQKSSDVDELEEQRAASKVTRWVDGQTGMHHTHVELDPVRDAELHSAVNASLKRTRANDGNAGTPWDQMLVEAFVEAFVGAGADDDADPSSSDERRRVDRVPEITVLISHDALLGLAGEGGICEMENGDPLPVSTVRRLCCDAEVLPVVLGGGGEVLDAGRSARTATRPQRRTLRAMHRRCAHPECTVGFDVCRIHHVKWWWEHHGPTDIDNLLPLCERHHHTVHEGGWTLTMTPDRVARWLRPDGSVFHEGSTIDRIV